MKYLILEKHSKGVVEHVKFFDSFLSHTTETEGKTEKVMEYYWKMKMSKEEAIEAYLKEGFNNVD